MGLLCIPRYTVIYASVGAFRTNIDRNGSNLNLFLENKSSEFIKNDIVDMYFPMCFQAVENGLHCTTLERYFVKITNQEETG